MGLVAFGLTVLLVEVDRWSVNELSVLSYPLSTPMLCSFTVGGGWGAVERPFRCEVLQSPFLS